MILKIKELRKRYNGQEVLDAISLELHKGMVLSLCGPSGAGKTTLVRIICGLLSFDAGELQLQETRVSANTPYPKDLYGSVGVVFQEHNLFPHMTTLENVTLALLHVKGFSKQDAVDRAMGELKRVGLAGKAKAYPTSLSGGERQRVAIARALAMEPVLLLLDEPTSGLDPVNINVIQKIIAELSERGTTMVLITHNIPFAQRIGSLFALMEEGRLDVSPDPVLLNRMRVEEVL